MRLVRIVQTAVRGALRLPGRRVRWKIMLPYTLLSLLAAVAGTYFVTGYLTRSLSDRFANQLAEAGRVTADAVVRQEQDHLEVVRAITFTQGVAEAVVAGDQGALELLVLPVVANAGTDQVAILDAAGRELYGRQRAPLGSAGYEQLRGDDLSGTAVVENVLGGRSDGRGDKFADLVTLGGEESFVTAGPILVDGRIVGVVLVGSRVDTLVATIKAQALADVTFYDMGWRPLASTFPVENADELAPSVAGAEARAGSRDGVELFGRGYEVLYGDLQLRGERVGSYSVGLPADFIVSTNRATGLQLASVFAIATLGALGIGWFLARRLTNPLHRLLKAATAVTSGDLTARSGVRGTDEIGNLAVAFDVMTERLQRQHLSTMEALVSAIDARDPYTRGHSVRVGNLSVEIGGSLGLPTPALQHLRVGGYLHDIGKIGVRDAVLLKQGSLTADERELIEQHPRIGLEILAPVHLPDEVKAIVGGHHERLNGEGYPLRLTAEELGVFPRIAAVADVYDAITTDRPYRAGMPLDEALKLLQRESLRGGLDPEVVAAMVRLAPRWEERRRSDPALQGLLFVLPGEDLVPPSEPLAPSGEKPRSAQSEIERRLKGLRAG